MLTFVNKCKVTNGSIIIISKNKSFRMVIYRPLKPPDF